LPATSREARERALELLYEAEAKELHPAEVVAGLPVQPAPYAAELAEGVGDHVELLDHLVGAKARGWTVARMPAVDRTLLRLAGYELVFHRDLPIAVVIDEAVELARTFSTDSSPKFVNGVLAAVARDVRDGGTWAGAAAPSTLVLDMDGVLRHWDPDGLRQADEALGLPEGTIAAVAFEAERLDRAMTGRLTWDSWVDEIAVATAEAHGCDRDEVARLWAAQTFTIDDEVRDLAEAVRVAGRRVACFSNASTRLEEDLDAAGVTAVFDVVVNSSVLGRAKPDPDAFAAAADAIGAHPGSCLFVDDRPENVHGALAAGMPAAVFRGPERLRAVLARTGLLPA
jgi:putative hydrolase of the HAD superfamily